MRKNKFGSRVISEKNATSSVQSFVKEALISFPFAELAKIISGPNIATKTAALIEQFSGSEGHFESYAAAGKNDFIDASLADGKGSSEDILEEAHGHEIVFKENFTGCDSGFHKKRFIHRFRRFTQISSF